MNRVKRSSFLSRKVRDQGREEPKRTVWHLFCGKSTVSREGEGGRVEQIRWIL